MSSKATASAEMLVNTHTATGKDVPRIAMLEDGGWIVSWGSYDQQEEDGGYDVYQQRYDAVGNRVGEETLVNAVTGSQHYVAQCTGLTDGGWIIVWNSLEEGQYETYQQRYDVFGAAVGEATRLNTYTANSQRVSDVIGLDDGGWLATWYSNGQDGSGEGVYQRRFDSEGVPEGDEVRVNTTTAGDHDNPRATLLADGGWLVTWNSFGEGSTGTGIYQQRYAASGATVGGEVHVNTTLTGNQLYADTAALSDGGWIVTWIDYGGGDGSGAGIFQQRFDSTGATVGDETLVNTNTTGAQEDQDVVGLADGGWVVCWTDRSGQDGGGYGIYQQRFDADGETVGDETLINVSTAGNQFIPSMTAFDDGGWVVSWESNHGGEYAIYQRHFAADVEGGKTANKLVGTDWGERISGFAGNDRLTGREGQDVLVGGGGADRFVFKSGDTDKTRTGADTIEDFSVKQKDMIDLAAIDADTTRGKNNAFDFIGDNRFHKEAGELRFDKKGGDTYVMGDTDGDGKADFMIHLDGNVKLTAGSFEL
jgi:Ca2+-binding RTX toxin-like protein